MTPEEKRAYWAERKRISRAGLARKPLPCGTEAAARRHRRRGEPVCDACREYERAQQAQRRQRVI
jgi:hypothetical protein